MTEAPERIWAQAEHNADDMDAGTFCTVNDRGVEYVRADLARPVTVAEAAKVLLDACPNPIFDTLKYPLMGEFSQTTPFVNEDGDEDSMEVTVEWTVTKDIIEAALRYLSHEGGE